MQIAKVKVFTTSPIQTNKTDTILISSASAEDYHSKNHAGHQVHLIELSNSECSLETTKLFESTIGSDDPFAAATSIVS